MINYPSCYNTSIKVFNENSFEIKYKNEKCKNSMRGGRFLLRKLVAFLYLIFMIIALIVFGVTKEVAGKIMFVVAFALSVIYFIIHMYNLIIYIKNGYIIGDNFIEDDESNFISKSSFYKILEINSFSDQELLKFGRHNDLIRYTIDRYKISDGPFKVVFYKKGFYQYANCGIILFYSFFSTLFLATCILVLLDKLGILR